MLKDLDGIACLGDPRHYDCDQYVEAVYSRNEKLLSSVGNILDNGKSCRILQEIIQTGIGENVDVRVGIVTTGSDGRKEKKGDHTSPLEVVVLVKRSLAIERISDELRVQCLSIINDLGIFGGLIEIKDLDLDKVAYCQDYFPPSPWPTIVIDFFPLGNANGELVNLSRELLFKEVVSSGGKLIVESVKKRLKEYRQVTRTGQNSFKGNAVKHFDRESGELFYDQSSAVKQGSVKYGPLRTIQMFLANKILQFMIEHSSDADFIQKIPGQTEAKIATLLDSGALNLNDVEAKELTQLYKYFLWCFYLSEYSYSQNGKEKVVVVPDVQLFRENIDNLLKLIY